MTPPDRFRFTTLAHAGRALLGPLADASAAALLARLAPGAGGRVIDVGCGKGELLVRAMTCLAASGVGVEPNPAFAAATRERAARSGLAARLVLHERAWDPALVAGATFDLAICTGATHAFGDWPTALAALGALVAPGGHALAGTAYWRRAPDAGYLATLGAEPGELAPLDATLAATAAAGWRIIASHESTLTEWDDYEGAYAAGIRRWLAAHPDDADAPAFRTRIETWSAAYTRWGRDTLGFVTLLLAH